MQEFEAGRVAYLEAENAKLWQQLEQEAQEAAAAARASFRC